MQTDAQTPSELQPQVVATPPAPAGDQPHGHKLYWAVILLLVLVGTSTNAWQYFSNHKTVDNLGTQSTGLTNSSSSAASQYASNTGTGFPLSLAKKELVTTLYLPKGYAIIQTSGGFSSQDSLAQTYVETYNDIVANWEFSDTGTKANPSDPLLSNDSITLSAMNDWMTRSDPSTVNYPLTVFNDPSGPMTPSQKTAFVNKAADDTKACAADKTKGFSTNDKVLNVCYIAEHPNGAGGSYILSLEGFGKVDGTNLFLQGFIDLPKSYDGTSKTQSLLDSYLQALMQLSIAEQANPNTQ